MVEQWKELAGLELVGNLSLDLQYFVLLDDLAQGLLHSFYLPSFECFVVELSSAKPFPVRRLQLFVHCQG